MTGTGGTGGLAGGGAAGTGGATTTTTTINALAGGTITIDGLVLEIPPGALAVDTAISVAVSDGASLPAAATLVAKVYDLGPSGTTFSIPVRLTIDVDTARLGGKNPVVSYLSAGAWVALTNSVSAAAGKVTASTTHFTPFGVVGSDAAACGAMTKTACQACCKTTFAKGAGEPLSFAINACACTTGSPCNAVCVTNTCASSAPSTDCQTCLNTQGSANPQPACITQGQQACAASADCAAYTACQLGCSNSAPTDAGTDAPPACVSYANTAPTITLTKVAAALPAPTGGTIMAGTYHLTEEIEYTGPGGAVGSMAGVYNQTHQLTATTWSAVVDVPAAGLHLDSTATYTVSGTTFTPTKTCPTTGNPLAASGYSATANEVRFLPASGATGKVQVLVRQP